MDIAASERANAREWGIFNGFNQLVREKYSHFSPGSISTSTIEAETDERQARTDVQGFMPLSTSTAKSRSTSQNMLL